MTLAQIMKLALRQLDEDIEDIDEYVDLFTVYANTGYRIAVDEYLKPREIKRFTTDAQGVAQIDPEENIRRIVELRRILVEGERWQRCLFDLAPDGRSFKTRFPDAEIEGTCEVRRDDMEELTDEPMLPEHTHPALAHYICYMHLSNGNLAKQSRAQHYQQLFYQEMQRIRPEGFRSVTGFSGLYEVTDARYRR